jgi:hypothetical protein
MTKEDKAKIKMTVVHFETESSNEALQENIRVIANTLTRALTPPPTRVVPAQLTSGNGAGNGMATDYANEAEQYEDVIDTEVIDSPKKPKKTGNRQVTTPKVLELDLESGPVPVKTFIEQKNPAGDNKRYLAIAYWLKEHRSISEVTMHHVHTCYRRMGWNTPKDASQPLRAMKQQGWMNNGSVRGAYAINHVGEGVVNDMGATE